MLELTDLDKIFVALSNKHRREIVYSLSLHPHSISHLAKMRNLSLQAIHKHIEVLENAGLLHRKKSGQTYFLALKRQALHELQDWLMQYHPFWGNDNETLENYQHYLKGGEKK